MKKQITLFALVALFAIQTTAQHNDLQSLRIDTTNTHTQRVAVRDYDLGDTYVTETQMNDFKHEMVIAFVVICFICFALFFIVFFKYRELTYKYLMLKENMVALNEVFLLYTKKDTKKCKVGDKFGSLMVVRIDQETCGGYKIGYKYGLWDSKKKLEVVFDDREMESLIKSHEIAKDFKNK